MSKIYQSEEDSEGRENKASQQKFLASDRAREMSNRQLNAVKNSTYSQESRAREARLRERDKRPGETQTERDTRIAKSRTQADTDKAKAIRQREEDARKPGAVDERMSRREAASGLNLAGNNPTSGRSPKQDETASKEARFGRERKRRETREKEREIRKQYKEARSNTRGSKDRRALRNDFKAALKDIETDSESNKAGADSSIQEDSIDDVESQEAAPESEGGGIPEGYAEQSVTICINGSPVTGTILFKS